MNVLILGGTQFLGVLLTASFRAAGHDVTHFNRGLSNAEPIEGVCSIRGDRTIGFDALQDERFDAVVDTSGYLPNVVERAARFFVPRAQRYVFISSVSVHDIRLPELFEDSPMPPLPKGASRTVMTDATYGPLKAHCERIIASGFRHRATIVRPGLIVGPHDPTDRFTYWPERFARGGEILAPGSGDRAVQFVDARDVAEFVVQLLERDTTGVYNVTSPQGLHTVGEVLLACGHAARTSSSVHWVDDDFLVERGVAPWMDLPLWIPPSAGIPGLLNVNVARALIARLKIRPLAQTVRETLQWSQTRPRNYILRAGLSPEREFELLAQLAAL